jgi:hypothetical protein
MASSCTASVDVVSAGGQTLDTMRMTIAPGAAGYADYTPANVSATPTPPTEVFLNFYSCLSSVWVSAQVFEEDRTCAGTAGCDLKTDMTVGPYLVRCPAGFACP